MVGLVAQGVVEVQVVEGDKPGIVMLLRSFWQDRLLIAVCVIVGIVLAGILVIRPVGTQFITRITLPAVAWFVPSDGIFGEFQFYWERSSLGPDSEKSVDATFEVDARSRAIVITAVAGTGSALTEYATGIKALVRQFEGQYAERANVQLVELSSVAAEYPEANASEYVATTAHKVRLTLRDVNGPGLLGVVVEPPTTLERTLQFQLLTVALGFVVGLLTGLLVSLGRITWMAGAMRAPTPKAG